MNEHIAKPISPKQLFDALLKWIEPGERELARPDEAATEQAASPVEELPELAGIDTAAGIARMVGNIGSYRKLLAKFVDNQADAIEKIRSAVADEEGEIEVRLAHTLKGVGGSIGAETLQAAAAKLETALKKDSKKMPPRLISQTEGELDKILAVIKSAFPEDAPEPGSGNGEIPADFDDQLQTLLGKLEEYDSEAADLLDDISGQVMGTPASAPLQALKKAVGQYDFDGAVDQVKDIINKYT